MANVEYVWLDGPSLSDSDWETQTAAISRVIDARGWMKLNRPTSRILIAEDANGGMLGFHVFQLVPYCGPLFVLPSQRGGTLASALADKMVDFLEESNTRGWIVTATSEHAAKMCESRGMTKIEQPVYVMNDPGGVAINGTKAN
jgi:hypothetical protein